MNSEEIEYLEGNEGNARGVKKKDQLTYRTTLQKMAEKSLFTQNHKEIKENIVAFKTSLYFNKPGLQFKDKIDIFEIELDEAMDDWEKKEIKEYSDGIYYFPETVEDLTHKDRSLFKDRRFYAYYHTTLKFLIGLLADHDALMEAKGMVEYGEEKKKYKEEIEI